MHSRRIVAGLLLAGVLLGGARTVAAEAPPGPEAPAWDVTPPRVSYISGQVSFWRPGADEWAPAKLNTPLAPGDVLYVGADGNAEVQIGPRAFVRAAAGTQLGLDSQELDFVEFRVTAGHAGLDLRDLPPGHTVALGTPNAALTVEHSGYYRVSVGSDTTTVIAYRGGRATVTPADGGAMPLTPGQQVVLTGTDSPDLTTSAAPELSTWDRWNYSRTDSLIAAASPRYLPTGVYGAEQLERNGTWRVVETYGPVWVPTAVPAGWVPYTTGRWIWDPRYGWTWLDDAPWGWAPFHYGRWVFAGGFWAWAPGPVVIQPVYAPALVAFLGSPVVAVDQPLCWVALGWGEPVVPWWGRPGFVARPWWGGWGGPRIVNNVVINRTTEVNVQNITVYRNLSVRNAVVAVPVERFGRDHVGSARITQVDVSRLTPVHGPLTVKPVAASLVPATGPAPKPPDTIHKPVVFAPRTPRGAAEMPRAVAPAAPPVGPKRHSPRAPQAAKQPEPADPTSPRVPGVVKPTTVAEPSAPHAQPPDRKAESPERQRPSPHRRRVEAPVLPEPARTERPSRPDRIEPPPPSRGIDPKSFRRVIPLPQAHSAPAPPAEAGGRLGAETPAHEPQGLRPDPSPLNPVAGTPAPPSTARRPGPPVAQPKVIRPVPPAIHGPAALPPSAVRVKRADDGPRTPPGALVIHPSGDAGFRGRGTADQAGRAVGAGRDMDIPRAGVASDSRQPRRGDPTGVGGPQPR